MSPILRERLFFAIGISAGIFIGALSEKAINEKQAKAAYASRLEAADARCLQFSECIQDIQTWRTAAQVCRWYSSMEGR